MLTQFHHLIIDVSRHHRVGFDVKGLKPGPPVLDLLAEHVDALSHARDVHVVGAQQVKYT